MSQQNPPARPNAPANPFGSSGSRSTLPGSSGSAPGSRFGGSSAPQSSPSNPPQPAATPANRPAGLPPRLGTTKIQWRIVPAYPQLVRFELNGLGDPFHRLLGTPLNVELGDPETAMKEMEAGGELVEKIVERLEATWTGYDLAGAVLLYPWRKELWQVMAGRTVGTETEEEADYEDDRRKPPAIYRALDMVLVLNVLARTRANILVHDAALALEAQYLSQSLYSDDPRIVALALATGCIEETFIR